VARIWVVIYGDEYLCASRTRKHIVEYLFYKDVHYIGLGSGFEVVREKESNLDISIIPEVYLFRHEETGYLCTPEDRKAYDEWKDERVKAYKDTVNGLGKAIDTLVLADRRKDAKKLEKALKVLTKQRDLFVGKKADMDTMERIVKVDPQTIMEERHMFRDFMYKIHND